METLRTTPEVNRTAFRKVLAALPCTAKDVCELRDSCSEAYAVEQAAKDAIASVNHAAERRDVPVAPEAAELLQRAEGELGRARDLAVKCADREADLRRLYRL